MLQVFEEKDSTMPSSTRFKKKNILISLIALCVFLFSLYTLYRDLQDLPVKPSRMQIFGLESLNGSSEVDDVELFSTVQDTEQELSGTATTLEHGKMSEVTPSTKRKFSFNISSSFNNITVPIFDDDFNQNVLNTSLTSDKFENSTARHNTVLRFFNSSLPLNNTNASSMARNAAKPVEKAWRKRLRKMRQMFRRMEPLFKTKRVDCRAVFRRNQKEIQKAKKVAASPKRLVGISDAHYEWATKNCTQFVRDRGYITVPLSAEEREFPIAYSLLVYKDLEMVERLLRAIYRPQNYYCLHIDASSSPGFFRYSS